MNKYIIYELEQLEKLTGYSLTHIKNDIYNILEEKEYYKLINEKALKYCKESSLIIKSHFFSDLENILKGEDKYEKR